MTGLKRIFFIVAMMIVIFIGLTYFSLLSTSQKFKSCEIISDTNTDSIDFEVYDSVLVAASTLYESNIIKNLMQGKQYREAWSTPVKVPVIFLNTLMGGTKIIDEGGGMQTHSLKLKTEDDYIYSLRSVNKDVSALIPEFAKVLGLENILVDGISGQHPYAAVVVAELAGKAKILHTRPRIVFLPKQSALGKFNSKYGNRLYLLEHETDGGNNWTALPNVYRILDSNDLQKLKAKHGNKVSIDQRALVRARLFDLLIGDWDRHAKQWGWVVQKHGDYYKAIPLPGDRDVAFFNIGGLLPALILNKHFHPKLQSFGRDIDYLPGLVMPFDVYFLKTTPRQIFVEEAKALQAILTDRVIEEALRKWPVEIYDLHGREIASSIISRRDKLVSYAGTFRKILDQKNKLTEPLKGSEGSQLGQKLTECFDCE